MQYVRERLKREWKMVLMWWQLEGGRELLDAVRAALWCAAWLALIGAVFVALLVLRS